MNSIKDLLKEIEREQEIVGGAGSNIGKALDQYFQIELTYTSNAIEGNTLTRQETAEVIEHGITAAGRTVREHIEATNHAKAYEWVREKAHKSTIISENDLLELHQIILSGIDDSGAGRYRTSSVRIAGSRVILPNSAKVPALMSQYFKWLVNTKDNPIQVAIDAHYRLVSIHPFADGNGRTARLLMNYLLLRFKYPPLIVRKEDRKEYLNNLEAGQLGHGTLSYSKFMLTSLLRSYELLRDDKEHITLSEKELLKIGELATLTNEPVSTIRHWTKMGLLKVAQTTSGGYALYLRSEIAQTIKIRELQRKRMTLEEIKKKLVR